MLVTVHAEDMELVITGDRCLLAWQTPGAAGPATYGTGTAENPVGELGETDRRMELGNGEEKGTGFNNTIIARPLLSQHRTAEQVTLMGCDGWPSHQLAQFRHTFVHMRLMRP